MSFEVQMILFQTSDGIRFLHGKVLDCVRERRIDSVTNLVYIDKIVLLLIALRDHHPAAVVPKWVGEVAFAYEGSWHTGRENLVWVPLTVKPSIEMFVYISILWILIEHQFHINQQQIEYKIEIR